MSNGTEKKLGTKFRNPENNYCNDYWFYRGLQLLEILRLEFGELYSFVYYSNALLQWIFPKRSDFFSRLFLFYVVFITLQDCRIFVYCQIDRNTFNLKSKLPFFRLSLAPSKTKSNRNTHTHELHIEYVLKIISRFKIKILSLNQK